MIFFLIPLVFFMFDGMQISIEGFQKDYLSKNQTNAIKGIFVLLIFLSHASSYMLLDAPCDAAYVTFKKFFRQMVVAMFLFYSGYGMTEAIKRKGLSYIKAIPRNRFLTVLINFDLAVLLYLILNSVLKHRIPPLNRILLSFVGIRSLGNSNWYIFAVLLLYLLMFCSFILTCKIQNSRLWQFVSLSLLSVAVITAVYIEIGKGLDTCWYNTMFLFVVGCWYSFFKDQIEAVLMKNNFIYLLIFTVMLCAYFTAFEYRGLHGIWTYTIWGILFTLTIVVITMKISINNPILIWFGKNVFSIYILQRIPMIIFNYFGLTQSHRYIFVVLSFFITLCISMMFNRLTGWVSGKIRKA